MKRIPTSFQLAGYTITVKLVTEAGMAAAAKDTDCYGLFDPDGMVIYLIKPSRKLKTAVVLQTFWHEAFHALLWVAAHPLWKNEAHVNQCGNLMHQLISTAKFK